MPKFQLTEPTIRYEISVPWDKLTELKEESVKRALEEGGVAGDMFLMEELPTYLKVHGKIPDPKTGEAVEWNGELGQLPGHHQSPLIQRLVTGGVDPITLDPFGGRRAR
jgi:hypothetical protein